MRLFVNQNFILETLNIILLITPLICALLAINFKNLYYVLLSLLGTFITTAICWIKLDAEFLAFSVILLYAAITVVLFLLFIMTLSVSSETNLTNFLKNQPDKTNFFPNKLLEAILIVITFTLILTYIVKDYNFSVTTVSANNNLFLLADRLFDNYMLLFTATGLLLLSTIVVASCLVEKQVPSNIVNKNTIKPSKQQRKIRMLDL